MQLPNTTSVNKSVIEAARALPRGMLRELNGMLHEGKVAMASGITRKGLGGSS